MWTGAEPAPVEDRRDGTDAQAGSQTRFRMRAAPGPAAALQQTLGLASHFALLGVVEKLRGTLRFRLAHGLKG